MDFVKAAHQRLIEEVIQKAKDDFRVVGIVLYGSALVRPDYHDIDLCIFPVNNCNVSELYTEYFDFSKEPIDIRIFNDLPFYIQNRVIKEGKIILQNDYDKMFNIFIATIIKWNDFRKYCLIILERFFFL